MKKVRRQTKRSGDGNSLAAALSTVNADEIIDAEILPDRSYSENEFLNCSGTLCGSTVRLYGEKEPFWVCGLYSKIRNVYAWELHGYG